MVSRTSRKTVSLSDETHDLLTKTGNKGETYDDIIKRLARQESKANKELESEYTT